MPRRGAFGQVGGGAGVDDGDLGGLANVDRNLGERVEKGVRAGLA